MATGTPRISRFGMSAATAGALAAAAGCGWGRVIGAVGKCKPQPTPADAVRMVGRMRGSGEARLVASGALLQQVAQASGLLALLVIVTLLARDLEVAELGAYGLVASLAGYLLVLRNSVASAAVRAMAVAAEGDERASVFVVARRLYALVGVATGA